MTEAALQRLKNERGFFLMVESASIDKQSHERKPCGSIGEVDQLEETLKAALAFAQENPETLILVTADHGQAAQMIPEYSLFSAFGAPVFTRGHLARIITPEGGIMGVNYATNDFIMEEHTGVNVPVFGNSEALGRVPTMITQPEIYRISKRYLLDRPPVPGPSGSVPGTDPEGLKPTPSSLAHLEPTPSSSDRGREIFPRTGGGRRHP